MLKVPQILVRAITLVGGAALLVACGQKGALVIPTEAAARQRATLVQVVRPNWARTDGGATRSSTTIGSPPAPATPAAVTAPPTEADLVPESTLAQ